jgi:N-acetylmuramoyl-L-alanine amidase
VAGIPDGSIDQDFSKGSKIASMATLMKDYNAGGATYRTPGVAQHDQAGRIWYDGNGSNWANISPSKPQIIDDYIVAGTYLYYQISSGQTVTYNDTASYVAEALKNQDQVKGYTFGGSTGGQVSGGCVAGGCSNNGTGAGGGNTVVLDPGHAGANTEQVDPTTGIETLESGGAPGEMQNMWDTAQLIKTKLEAAGYSVVLTKNSEDDTAGFVTKVARANSANAAIAVSLHYTDGTFGVANDHYGVTPQVVGEFRQNNDNGKRATFTDTALDQKSAQYAQAIAAARNATGDTTKVDNLDNSFPPNRPDILAYGNIPIVELLGKVPWVYNEVGDQGFDMQKYATGITNGIMAAVPLSGNQTTSTATGSTTSCGAVAGSVVQTAMNYAWPDFKGNPFCDEEPAYKTAIDTAKANGQYTGAPCDTDSTLAGIDCGAFVTRVMIDSNADPGYNDSGKGGNTIPQEAYLKAQTAAGKYQLITPTTTDDLLAGDIAIVNNASREHTYLYVGETSSHPSFHGNAASASQGTRAPMADGVGTGDLTTFSWYRLIK